MDVNDAIANSYGITGIPETFVLDAEGKVAYVHIGPVTAEQLDKSWTARWGVSAPMSVGSALVGVAVILLTLAYLGRPFRSTRALADTDRAIDYWVEELRAEETSEAKRSCRQCGRDVGPDDRFCPGCGTALEGEAR
jgi:hypothetical protein